MVERGSHTCRHFGGRHFQRAGHAAQRVLDLLQISQRVVAGDGFDTSDACRHTRLGHDLEQANVPAALHMGAAAEFAARADVEHADLIAVLFAEQHHRAELLRLFERQYPGLRRRIGQHLGVDQGLDLSHLLIGDRRVVREIEACSLGVDQRALLLHMRAQHFAQCLVHQVRRAVVAHGLGALLGVDAGDEAVADLDLALDDAALVAKHRGLDLGRVLDDHARARVAQLAGVADLATALGVEGRVVERDHHVVARACAIHRRAVDVDRCHRTLLADQMLVAVKRGIDAAVGQALRHLELARGAGLFALAVHRQVEAGFVDRDAAFATDIGGQVEREAEGVVQLEGDVALQHSRS